MELKKFSADSLQHLDDELNDYAQEIDKLLQIPADDFRKIAEDRSVLDSMDGLSEEAKKVMMDYPEVKEYIRGMSTESLYVIAGDPDILKELKMFSEESLRVIAADPDILDEMMRFSEDSLRMLANNKEGTMMEMKEEMGGV